MHVFWDITRECNFACVHCYNAPQRASAPPDADTALRLQIVRNLSAEHPGSVLHLLGGEPTLIDDFEDVVNAAISAGLRLEITTNGSESAYQLAPLLLGKFEVVHISLDGATAASNDRVRGRGTFEQVVRLLNEFSVTSLTRRRANLDLSFTLTRGTLGQAQEIVRFCLDHDLASLTIQPVKILGNALRSERKFGITAHEYFEFACQLAHCSVGERLRVNVTGGSKRAKDYIKWKYFNDVMSVETGCDAGTGQLRIDSMGRTHGCIVADRIDANVIQFATPSAKEANTSKTLSRQVRTLHLINERGQPPICRSCNHLHEKSCYGGCAIQGNFGPSLLCAHLNELKAATLS